MSIQGLDLKEEATKRIPGLRFKYLTKRGVSKGKSKTIMPEEDTGLLLEEIDNYKCELLQSKYL
jgi:hypothetical protein